MPQNRTTRIIPIITRITVCIVIIAAAFGIVKVLMMTKEPVKTHDLNNKVLKVETMTAQRVPVARQWGGFGTAQAMDTADVSAEVSALVQEVILNRRVGSPIKAGETIVQLDDSDFRHDQTAIEQTIKQHEAKLQSLAIEQRQLEEQVTLTAEEVQLARQEYERALQSVRANAGNEVDVDRRRSEYVRAQRTELDIQNRLNQIEPSRQEKLALITGEQARLDMAKRNVERCRITAPIDGLLESVDVEEGEQVGLGMRVARIVNLERIEIPIQFPISAMNDLFTGDSIQLHTEGADQKCWPATLARFSPLGRSETRTCIAFAELTQAVNDETWNQLLLPGRFLQVDAVSSQKTNIFIVPRRAVLNDTIYVINDSTVHQRQADIIYHFNGQYTDEFGVRDLDWAALGDSTDLRPGDVVILSNVEDLKPGMAIAAGSDHTKKTKTDHPTKSTGG